MSGWRQIAGGLGITLVVILMIGASLSTAIAEQRLLIEPIPPTRTASAATQAATQTPAPAGPGTATAPATQTGTATIPPPPTTCPPPEGWAPYEVKEGDTLAGLAAALGVSPGEIAAGNCLSVTSLVPGSILYLPAFPPTPTPSATATPAAPPTNTPKPCGPPPGWLLYTVQSGDTLFSLAQAMNTSVAALQSANCLGSSTYIQAGAKIWVPFIPTQTPTKTPTASRTPTPSQTGTLPPTATATVTVSPSPTATSTTPPAPSPTATTPPAPTPTATPSPTQTTTRHPPTATETGTAASMPSSPH